MADLAQQRADARVRNAKKAATETVDPMEAVKKEESEYQAALPANRRGIGGAGWRSSTEGKAHREAWKKKRITPVPKPTPTPGLTDIAKP